MLVGSSRRQYQDLICQPIVLLLLGDYPHIGGDSEPIHGVL